MADDPLEGIHLIPQDQQIAVLISVLRSTRNSMNDVKAELRYVKRALWTLVTTIIVGIIIFIVTAYSRPHITSNISQNPIVKVP